MLQELEISSQSERSPSCLGDKVWHFSMLSIHQVSAGVKHCDLNQKSQLIKAALIQVEGIFLKSTSLPAQVHST